MTETNPPAGSAADPTSFLDPTTRAVAGLVLAVVGMLAPNLLQTALQVVVDGGVGGNPQTYFVATAVGAAVPLGLAAWLAAEPARSAASGWATPVARAAVVVALVGLVGALLLFFAALVRGY